MHDNTVTTLLAVHQSLRDLKVKQTLAFNSAFTEGNSRAEENFYKYSSEIARLEKIQEQLELQEE